MVHIGGGGRPVGQRPSIKGSRPWEREIVGVVRDAIYESLREAPPPTVYMPYFHWLGQGNATFVIQAGGSLVQTAEMVRSELRPRLPGAPLQVRTMTLR